VPQPRTPDAVPRDLLGGDAAQWLRPFERVPGLLYFVRDLDGRLVAISPEWVAGIQGTSGAAQVLGSRVRDLAPPDLAEKYALDDEWVLAHGEPLLNIVEVVPNERGLREWAVTDKYPLRDARGRVAGLLGVVQRLETRRQLLAHLGPAGRAADFIRSHLGEDLSLARVADHVALSERQLVRLFRRAFGMSVRQFVIHSRVHAATHELTRTDKSLAQIARSLGFGDQSALSNTFRRITGTTPRAYRARHVERLTP
jgi:AraC-like DNA-binding protein